MRTEEYNCFIDESDGWAVANTQAHREALTLQHLERQDFEAYCPMIRKRVRHARKSMDVKRPMFPGYVFIRVAPKHLHWRPILSTVGVRSLLCTGNRPNLLDGNFIESLKAREVDGLIIRPDTPYKIGQQVRLTTGAFHGLVATIIELQEKDRLTVLMQLLNGEVKVSIQADCVNAL